MHVMRHVLEELSNDRSSEIVELAINKTNNVR
jgi:hypothetical protein